VGPRARNERGHDVPPDVAGSARSGVEAGPVTAAAHGGRLAVEVGRDPVVSFQDDVQPRSSAESPERWPVRMEHGAKRRVPAEVPVVSKRLEQGPVPEGRVEHPAPASADEQHRPEVAFELRSPEVAQQRTPGHDEAAVLAAFRVLHPPPF
jgi:hypothetical protein